MSDAIVTSETELPSPICIYITMHDLATTHPSYARFVSSKARGKSSTPVLHTRPNCSDIDLDHSFLYMFGLYPEDAQPSGTANFSRLESVTLDIYHEDVKADTTKCCDRCVTKDDVKPTDKGEERLITVMLHTNRHDAMFPSVEFVFYRSAKTTGKDDTAHALLTCAAACSPWYEAVYVKTKFQLFNGHTLSCISKCADCWSS